MIRPKNKSAMREARIKSFQEEASKELETSGFFATIPLSKMIKLEKFLAERRESKVNWLLGRIEELP